MLSRQKLIRSTWAESEMRHGILAFGAGALLAAVALVLIPSGVESLSLPELTIAGGGILYLMFQEIAPKVVLKESWLPPMGALFGFFVGVLGSVLIG